MSSSEAYVETAECSHACNQFDAALRAYRDVCERRPAWVVSQRSTLVDIRKRLVKCFQPIARLAGQSEACRVRYVIHKDFIQSLQ